MTAMNISVNVDCTPEEARRFMGLPDLSSIHELYLEKLRDMMEQGLTPGSIETLMRNWAPMGEASMSMWRQLFENMGSGGFGCAKR